MHLLTIDWNYTFFLFGKSQAHRKWFVILGKQHHFWWCTEVLKLGSKVSDQFVNKCYHYWVHRHWNWVAGCVVTAGKCSIFVGVHLRARIGGTRAAFLLEEIECATFITGNIFYFGEMLSNFSSCTSSLTLRLS